MTQLPKKHLFHLPEGLIYLDGNSLGPIPKSAAKSVESMMVNEWGEMLIRGWNAAGWMNQPAVLGDQIGALIGAAPGSTMLGDTLSIKVYQALAAALDMRPDRRVILSDTGNFPTDLYMAEGLVRALDRGHTIRTVDPTEVLQNIDGDTAVVMLTHVDYRTGRLHDMAAITQAAHDAGAVVIWDLAHTAGALPVNLTEIGCEFAVGCTYKYLNGGPGAPAFITVRPDLIDSIQPALSGWLGHEAPFAFDLDYRPGAAMERMRVGTPPVIQMAALAEAMKVWDGVDMADIRTACISLSERFIAGVEENCPDLTLASPRDPSQRGSQVSFAFEHGYAAMQALIADGVIGDFRAPNLMRFGFTPLFLDEADIDEAVARLAHVMTSKKYENSQFQTKSRVT